MHYARKFLKKLFANGTLDPLGTWAVDMPNPANEKDGRPHRLYQLRRVTDGQAILFQDDGLTRYPHGKPLNGRMHLVNQVSRIYAEEQTEGGEVVDIPLYFSDKPLDARFRRIDGTNITVKPLGKSIKKHLDANLEKRAANAAKAAAQFNRMKKHALYEERAELNAADRAAAINTKGADPELERLVAMAAASEARAARLEERLAALEAPPPPAPAPKKGGRK